MSEEAAIYGFPKRTRWESKKYRDAAREQPCTLRLSCCNRDKKTTVLAHRPGAGMGIKTDDFDAVDACSACHDALDGRADWPEGYDKREEFERARWETVTNRIRRGVLK
ncbi:MAG: nuclease domain-containing protein [Desulfuromonadales bacterium]|nr:nuclease domain-containing protein [Desulfuromonadales bacterium]